MEQPAQPSVWEDVPENHFLEVVHLLGFFIAIILAAAVGLLNGLDVHIPVIIAILGVWIPIAFQGLASKSGHRLKPMGRTFVIALIAFVVLLLVGQGIDAIP